MVIENKNVVEIDIGASEVRYYCYQGISRHFAVFCGVDLLHYMAMSRNIDSLFANISPGKYFNLMSCGIIRNPR